MATRALGVDTVVIASFRRRVFRFYHTHGRTFPWRNTTDPYHILVSEIMLQQTQAERVVPKYSLFLKKFPTVSHLARAPLREVLKSWQGLGYNRRAQRLHESAKVILETYKGIVPREYETLCSLPGVGAYTAGAVCAFAYNIAVPILETNIRTVFIHHFFPEGTTVSDSELIELVKKTLPKSRAREWYSALMDYGTYLKASKVRVNARVRGYAKQRPLKGSRREIRGAIIRAVSKKEQSKRALLALFEDRRGETESVLTALLNEKMLVRKGSQYTLPS